MIQASVSPAGSKWFRATPSRKEFRIISLLLETAQSLGGLSFQIRFFRFSGKFYRRRTFAQCLLHSSWNSTECKYTPQGNCNPSDKTRFTISLTVCELPRQLVFQGWERTKPTPSVAEAIGLDYRGFHEPATSKHIIRMTLYMSSRSWSTNQWTER